MICLSKEPLTAIAFEIYVQNKINSSLTKSLFRAPHVQLLSFFEEKTIHQPNFQSSSLVRRKKKGYLDLRRPKKCKKHFKKSLKNIGVVPAEACEGGRRD